MAKILQLITDKDGDAVSIDFSGKPGDRQIECSVGALKGLTGPELVTLHNSLVEKDAHVERFSDKETGAKKLLIAIEAVQAIPFTEREIAERGPGRPPKTAAATLHVVKAVADKKSWQKGSARYAAFQVIASNDGLSMESYRAKAGPNASALLAKMVEVGVVEVRE